ncbi:hypothetical protein AW27_023400 [Streptomyces sp. PCS3-D2]|uniref:hypothetical protein n=1 Tax=Streptomyces sp. PCS3-D2 TaxID=1460244 RepID=UPI0012FF52D1|nr:hypothetical protein [Streptomyces sp. PCS3-D2]WKV74190.1 hypothetical protein AW27_023400 [Streptomyces sp. PCS3-D2]
MVQPDHEYVPLQPPLMTTTDATAAVTATFAEIAALANKLCDHLADAQFETAARIRALAESAAATNGEH